MVNITSDQPVALHTRLRASAWPGYTLVLLGLWLICAPWVLAPDIAPMNGPLRAHIGLAIVDASWVDCIGGALIAAVGVLAAFRHPALAWLDLLFGAVVFAVPWFCGLLGPAEAGSPPTPVLSGFALLFFVLPGMGGFVWNSWLTGAAVLVLSIRAGISSRRMRSDVRPGL
jgi:hypothetical protein